MMRKFHLLCSVFVAITACDEADSIHEDADVIAEADDAVTPESLPESDPRLELLLAEDDENKDYTPIDDLAQPPPDPLAGAICTGWEAGGRTCVTQCSAEPGVWHSTGAKYPSSLDYGDCGYHADWWCAVTGRGDSTWPCWGFPTYP